MKLKVQHVADAALVVTNIINRAPPMPQRGKYLLARMHAKLIPEFKIIDARRDEMIKAYDNPQVNEELLADGTKVVTPVAGQWQVPPDKMPEFIAAWKVVGDEEIDVDVQPIPIRAISLPDGSDGAIEAHELITLGELIADTDS